MSTLTTVLNKNLLAGASATKRNVVSIAVLAVGAAAGLANVPSGVLQAVTIPVALISMVVALRIIGPQDAKSFRLYRLRSAA